MHLKNGIKLNGTSFGLEYFEIDSVYIVKWKFIPNILNSIFQILFSFDIIYPPLELNFKCTKVRGERFADQNITGI
jgi:hypothetical protein